MSYSTPPYRLETLEDIHAFLMPDPDKDEKALLRFAKAHIRDIKKPPILKSLRTSMTMPYIHHADQWIGCIYMLDYSDQNVLIIDRIQIGEDNEKSTLINIFGDFMNQFKRHLDVKNSLEILATSRISNSSDIQSSFERYVKGLPRRSFPLGFEDAHFECALQKMFYVVRGGK
ncbi:MAG: hypothetical protein JW943_02320 [Deltaproteobacteria bacterium]|nr:hypothetical protein [Deltaproteobacteria bacterium]